MRDALDKETWKSFSDSSEAVFRVLFENRADAFDQNNLTGLYKIGSDVLHHSLEQFIREMTLLLEENLISFTGSSLIRDDLSLEIILERDYTIADAWVSQKPSGTFSITVTSGCLIALALLASANFMHLKELFPNTDDDKYQDTAEEFNRYLDNSEHNLISTLFPKGFSQVRKLRFVHFVRNFDTDDMRQYWNRVFSYSAVWVVLHELGHIRCGHIQHFLSTGLLSLREKIGVVEGDTNPNNRKDALNDIVIEQLAAELFADSYATISLALLLDKEPITGTRKHSDHYDEFFGTLTVCSQLALLLFEATVSTEEDRDENFTTHPPPWCRLLGSFATINFIIYPEPSTTIDPRKNPLEDSIRNKFGMNNRLHFGAMMAENYEASKGLLINLNIDAGGLSNRPGEFEHFLFCMEMSKFGLCELRDDIFPYQVNWKHQRDYMLWCGLFSKMCTEYNLYFANHLERSWQVPAETEIHIDSISDATQFGPLLIERAKNSKSKTTKLPEGLINDPAYKILDDWMSNVYDGTNLPKESKDALVKYCAGLAIEIGQLYQSDYRGAVNFTTYVPDA